MISNTYFKLHAPRLLTIVLGVLFLSGCVTALPVPEGGTQPAAVSGLPVPEGGTQPAAVSGERISDIANFSLPTPEPVIVADVTGQIITEDARANVRSGPALDAPIVAKADPGDSFQVTGRSEDSEWWQICCVAGPNDEGDEATERAWVSSVVVEVTGNADAVPVIAPLLPTDLTSTWQVEWECGSERCEVKECVGSITAKVAEGNAEQWLQVEHDVIWSDGCFEDDSWVFEVDRYAGQERSGAFVDDFRYNYWLGAQPGPATNVFTFEDGRKVAVWCGAEQSFDVPVGEGWTNSVEGHTCHDVRTGEMLYITYTTRWLYTGSYEGQSYERAYFGDFETLEQYLVDTNAELAYID